MSSSVLITYSMSRPFYGLNVPIPIQSAYLRDYAQRNDMAFRLPITEVCQGASYYCLSNIFRSLDNHANFAAVSVLCLPLKDDRVYSGLMSLVSSKADVRFHFPLEGFVGDLDDLQRWRRQFLLMTDYRGRVTSWTKFNK